MELGKKIILSEITQIPKKQIWYVFTHVGVSCSGFNKEAHIATTGVLYRGKDSLGGKGLPRKKK